jgi:hypothetical protein
MNLHGDFTKAKIARHPLVHLANNNKPVTGRIDLELA